VIAHIETVVLLRKPFFRDAAIPTSSQSAVLPFPVQYRGKAIPQRNIFALFDLENVFNRCQKEVEMVPPLK
jgi:hypothetical protein